DGTAAQPLQRRNHQTTALLLSHFNEEIIKQGVRFSNGRFVRNLFEKMIKSQAIRLGRRTGDLDTSSLSAVTLEDARSALNKNGP
ncbi:hypothetical protein, partial [Pseudoduganella sp. RAF53_2]|uniref:hypothetical protein n=1 Tax=Pseudoduganella sp. RAF53_2 TaxID=3233060 RepID=UPI003F95C01D